jgi:sentrin-specific protease 7
MLIAIKRDWMKTVFQKPLAATATLSNTAPTSSTQDQVQQPSSVAKRPRLLNNLTRSNGGSEPQTYSITTKVPTQTETRRLSERPARTTRASQPLILDLGDFEDEPGVERYSQKHGLGPEWKKSLNYNSGRRRAVVDFKDLERLDDGEFLNDQLIDFYLLYMFDRMNVPRDKVYVFNTHFFTTLTRKVPGQKGMINYQGVARWTTKEDIFGYDYIVVPINQEVHWYLAIICNVSNIARTPTIEDLTKSDGSNSEASKKVDSETPRHEAIAEDVPSIPPPALVDSPPKPLVSHAATELVDPDDSDLNLVDPRATGPSAPSGSSSVAQSPAAETAQMKKLSLSDSKPENMLLSGGSSVPPKKPKRRLGPPAKKWDANEPIIVVLDSLGGGARSPAVRALKEYIRAEGQEKRGMDAKITQHACYAKVGQIPQQQNYSDCGVYLLGYAQKFFVDPDLFKSRLLSGMMEVETDWPDMTMSTMRAEVRDILQRLAKDQEVERERVRKQKKEDQKSGGLDSTLDSTRKDVEQKPTVTPKAEATIATVDSKEATAFPDDIAAPAEEKPSLSSAQPPLRLASPFQPRSPQKRDRSRSTSAPAPTKFGVAPNVKGQAIPATVGKHASPTTVAPRKARSPKVLIPSPARKSPKRPLEAIVVGNSPDETTKKKIRTDLQSPKDFMDGEPRIVGIRSPEPKSATLPKRREKTPIVATPRVASAPARGSSRDPINIDDSQEALVSAIPRSYKRNSQGPDFIITSPKSAKATRLPPRRHQHEYMSSPAKSSVQRGSPTRRRETRSANESPDPIVDLDTPSPRFQSGSSQPNRPRWRAKTPEEDMPEKTIEVPETPPHDG